MKIGAIGAALTAFAAVTGWASYTDDVLAIRDPRTADVRLGHWHADLVKARAYAESKGVPLVAVWSHGDFCTHCKMFEGAITTPLFKQWMETSGMVFYIGLVDDGSWDQDGGTGPSSDGMEGYHGQSFYWCCKNQNATLPWPYIRIYWPKGGVDVVDTGAHVDGEEIGLNGFPCQMYSDRDNPPYIYAGDNGTFNPASRYFYYYLMDRSSGVLRNFTPVPDYAGGEFAMKDADDAPKAALQIEKEMRSTLLVPLTRTNATARASEAINYLLTVFADGSAYTNTVRWAVGEAVKDVSVPYTQAQLKTGGNYAATIRLELYNKEVKVVERSKVAIVDPVQNSPKNPLWLGERTADNLGAGEWTMDFAVATNRVKRYNDDRRSKGSPVRAHTLLLFSGSLWCPDCKAAEDFITGSDDFKKWAKDNCIACVAFDKPPSCETEVGSGAVCLLSHETAKSTKGRQYWPGTSGSGWLSRHGVPTEKTSPAVVTASEILMRDYNAVTTDTQHGGYLLPGKTGMGVPTFVLLRENGEVAGRIAQLASDTSMLGAESAATFVRRLDELLAQDAMETEEANDSIAGTFPEKIRIGGLDKVKGESVSFSDAVDYRRIDVTRGTRVEIEMTGSADADLILAVVDGTTGKEVPEAGAVATNKLSAGVSVACTLPSDRCFVRVSYPVGKNTFPPTGSHFAMDKSGSTVCGYELTSRCVYNPGPIMKTETNLPEWVDSVSVALVLGNYYKFTGLDDSVGTTDLSALLKDEGTGIYLALTSAPSELKLKGKSFGYQLWTPGEVAFSPVRAVVSEPEEKGQTFEYRISVRRTDLSGTAKARIYLDKSRSKIIDDGTAFDWTEDGHLFQWTEGGTEPDVQTVPITIKGNDTSDGDQLLVFNLVKEPGSDAEVSATLGEFRLTITDRDDPIPGKLALSAVRLDGQIVEIPARRVLTATAGSTLELEVDRVGGTDGFIEGSVTVDGENPKSVEWDGRDGELKPVTVTIPERAKDGSNRVVIELNGGESAQVSAEEKYIVVEIVGNDAAQFNQSVVTRTATRFVRMGLPLTAATVDIATLTGGVVRVEKKTGSLAPGLQCDFTDEEFTFEGQNLDAMTLYFYGTPTVAGTFTAVYQVFQDGVPGGTVQVVITVDDPATPADAQTPAVNPYLAATRTIPDIVVLEGDEFAGLLTVTIPRTGRLSAKFRPVEGEAVSLLCDAWSDYKAGTYEASLLSSLGEYLYQLEISVDAKGGVDLDFRRYPLGEGLPVEFDCRVPAADWSAAHPATKWKGYYTVSLPFKNDIAPVTALACGNGYVTMRMTDDVAVNGGQMTYAGILPNGKAFSGKAVLNESTGGFALLPVISVSTSDTIAGVFSVNPAANLYRAVYPCEDVYPFWKHRGEAPDGGDGYEQKLDIFGCLYDETKDLVACCEKTFQTTTLEFFANADKMVDGPFGFGSAQPWDPNSNAWITVSKTGLQLNPGAPAGTAFYFNRSTGLVYGTLNIDFVGGATAQAVFKGVVLPGWGAASCTHCGDGSEEAVKNPFISGGCWFSDVYEYTDAKERTRHLPVKRGCQFSVGLEAGK